MSTEDINNIALRPTDEKAHVLLFNNGNANPLVNIMLFNIPNFYLIVTTV